jgi:hypothetical protein
LVLADGESGGQATAAAAAAAVRRPITADIANTDRVARVVVTRPLPIITSY